VFTGRVRRFEVDRAVPHIGWNGIRLKKATRLFNTLCGDEKFYFVHSYYVDPEEEDVVLTTTDYDINFVSGVQKANITATQFHPEKSGAPGLALLENFLNRSGQKLEPRGKKPKTELAKRIIACLDVRANDRGDLVVTKGD